MSDLEKRARLMRMWKLEFEVVGRVGSYGGRQIWSPLMVTISIEAETRMNAVALATQTMTEEILQTLHYRVGTVISCMPVADGSDKKDGESE